MEASRGRSDPSHMVIGMGPGVLEAPPGFEPGMEVLQTSALPLGYGASLRWEARSGGGDLERETGFEPATSTLARSHSTTELFPLMPSDRDHE